VLSGQTRKSAPARASFSADDIISFRNAGPVIPVDEFHVFGRAVIVQGHFRMVYAGPLRSAPSRQMVR